MTLNLPTATRHNLGMDLVQWSAEYEAPIGDATYTIVCSALTPPSVTQLYVDADRTDNLVIVRLIDEERTVYGSQMQCISSLGVGPDSDEELREQARAIVDAVAIPGNANSDERAAIAAAFVEAGWRPTEDEEPADYDPDYS